MLKLILLTLLVVVVGPAMAAKRAFVIGNGTYLDASILPNPMHDAEDVAAKLTRLGFRVTLGLDLTRDAFLRSFQKFSRELQREDLALFYYAGHGVQIGGENYLFPTDAVVRNAEDVQSVLISLNALLASLLRQAKTQIVILDACRNNPFTPRIERASNTRAGGIARGLARVYAGVGSFIAYSTQPGNVAADGKGRNSPFTAALLRHMENDRIDVHALMRRVRTDVQQVSAGKQIPWESSS
ncbi:MAG: caspase family protein, partial [Hyphomicrobiaceae bacterium]